MSDTLICEACGDEFWSGIPPVPDGEHMPVLSDLPVCWDCITPTRGPDLQSFPAALSGLAGCPYCGVELEPPPGRGRRCKACGETFHVRGIPHPDDDVHDRRILTRDGSDELDDQYAEDPQDHFLGISISISYGTPLSYTKDEQALAAAIRGRCVSQYRRRELIWEMAAAGVLGEISVSTWRQRRDLWQHAQG